MERGKTNMEKIMTKEQAHDNFYDNLNNVSSLALQRLDPVHVLAAGLDYFLASAYESAPSLKEANKLINATVKRAKEENNG